jgi:poly-gamma-glutamate capsule biosynthesis protein CapA/YwtB (metallophosphatase superfamily)
MNANDLEFRPVTLFLCGDVMTGRGIDQILPRPSDPVLHEPYVESAVEYVAMAERQNGPIPRPVDFTYIWGDALEVLNRTAPSVRIVNLETSITTSLDYESKGINYRMHPANTGCLTAAEVDCCVLANNHVLDWGPSGLAETIRTLHEAGIATAGAGRNLREAWAPAAIETADSRVLVFAAGTSDSGIDRHWAATDMRPGVLLLRDLSDKTVGCIAEQVARIKRPGDIAVLSIHWGGNWGYQIPLDQILFTHRLVDTAGIDVIHGHSSHHPKGIEIYHDRPILYGCGDFLNDYEGIAGYESFRSHLVLAYFLAMNPNTGTLLHLEIVPFATKRLHLQRPELQDARWLFELLERLGKPLGTWVTLGDPRRFSLEWMR